MQLKHELATKVLSFVDKKWLDFNFESCVWCEHGIRMGAVFKVREAIVMLTSTIRCSPAPLSSVASCCDSSDISDFRGKTATFRGATLGCRDKTFCVATMPWESALSFSSYASRRYTKNPWNYNSMNTQLLNQYKYSLFQVEAKGVVAQFYEPEAHASLNVQLVEYLQKVDSFRRENLLVRRCLPGSNLQPPGLELHCRFRSTTPDCSATKSVSTIPLSWKQAPSQSLVVPVLRTWLLIFMLTKLMDQLIQFHHDVGLAARRFWSLLEPWLCEQKAVSACLSD